MQKKLLIRDLTLRDGQQSLLATRMTQQQVDKLLPLYKSAGFYAMEVWGGAVPDSVMRYLKENPWERLEKIKSVIGNTSKLTALSRGRNLFGYNPYPEHVIEGFCRNSVSSGIDVMRIFDALNDTDNMKSSIQYIKQNNGLADGAVCYTVDPKLPQQKYFFNLLKKEQYFKPVFTIDYFIRKAKTIEELGADMISVKDMAGLIPPAKTKEIIGRMKKELNVPIDFHTHCTPGFGLASVLTAIVNGVDIVDTNIWNFAHGPAAPSIEIISVFCKKLGVSLDLDFDAIEQINSELLEIRKELSSFDEYPLPSTSSSLKNAMGTETEKLFDKAIEACLKMDEKTLLANTHAIEQFFGFPAPDQKVREAEIPGGMYTNMLAQLKQLGLENLLTSVLKAVPQVRIDAGCPPLVTPTSQIIGVQAVNCVIDENKGLSRYTNNNTQFVNLVKGSYGKTPVPVKPEFRLKIAGTENEIPYDTSSYKNQLNLPLPELGNRKIAENEKDELLLELFPNVAEDFLKNKLKISFETELIEKQKQTEEEYLREKSEYELLSDDAKKEKLIHGLYNYSWFTYLSAENSEITDKEILEEKN